MCTANKEKGASAVEFALVLPVLMLILFGIIEFGFIIFDKAVITNASREGARAGIVYRVNASNTPIAVPTSTIQGIVDNYCASYLVSLGSSGTATTSTNVTGDCSTPGNSLTVSVTYPYTFLVLPNFANTLTGGITLSGVTVMRCENQIP